MLLKNLDYSKSLGELFCDSTLANRELHVSGIAIDSRKVKPGDLFLAYKGSQNNGMDYIEEAVQSGAIAIAIDNDETISVELSSTKIFKVIGLRKRAGYIISRFYDEPSKSIQLIGVTGTNGKTTVSYMRALCLPSMYKA